MAMQDTIPSNFTVHQKKLHSLRALCFISRLNYGNSLYAAHELPRWILMGFVKGHILDTE